MKTTRGYLERLVVHLGNGWRVEAKDPSNREGTTYLVRDRDELRIACNIHPNGFVARALVPAGCDKKKLALTAQTMPRTTLGIKHTSTTIEMVAARLTNTVIAPSELIYAKARGDGALPKVVAYSDAPDHDRKMASALAPMLKAGEMSERSMQIVDAQTIQIQITDPTGTRMVILASDDALALAISERAKDMSRRPALEMTMQVLQLAPLKECA